MKVNNVGKKIIAAYGDDFRNLPSEAHYECWRRLIRHEELLAGFELLSFSITQYDTYGWTVPDCVKLAYKKYIEEEIERLLCTQEAIEMLKKEVPTNP